MKNELKKLSNELGVYESAACVASRSILLCAWIGVLAGAYKLKCSSERYKLHSNTWLKYNFSLTC